VSNTNPERKLWVVEYNGTARSGKGTINSNLANMYVGAGTDETGADYRAVTKGALIDGKIELDMTPDDIVSVVAEMSVDELADYAAQRREIVAEYGTKVLYAPDVDQRVAIVSDLPNVRVAVKEGFKKRVTKAVLDPDISILFVDGRDIGKLVKQVPGAELLLSTFVECSIGTAAQRETAREADEREQAGSPMSDEEREMFYQDAMRGIEERNRRDTTRGNDPVRVADNPLRYWDNQHVIEAAVQRYVIEHGVTLTEARNRLRDNYYRFSRVGAGALAYAQKRQIFYDTNAVGKMDMIFRARMMVDEALQQATQSN